MKYEKNGKAELIKSGCVGYIAKGSVDKSSAYDCKSAEYIVVNFNIGRRSGLSEVNLPFLTVCSGGVMNGKIFFDALESGCELAHSVFEKYMDDVEVGVRSLINIFDPDAVIFSGGIMNRGDVFIKNLRGRIKTDVKLGISTLGSDAGIIGAALLGD